MDKRIYVKVKSKHEKSGHLFEFSIDNLLNGDVQIVFDSTCKVTLSIDDAGLYEKKRNDYIFLNIGELSDTKKADG